MPSAPTFNDLDASLSFTEGDGRLILDSDATIADADLPDETQTGLYTGATLTLERDGGASLDDSFGGSEPLTLEDGQVLLLEGGSFVAVGSYTSTLGTLDITFGTEATGDRINTVLQQINYANASDDPTGSIQIGYTFDNGTETPATGSVTVDIVATNDVPEVFLTASTEVYQVGGSALALVSGPVDVSDRDGTTLTGATVTITNAATGDILAADTTGSGITGNYSSGTLTLTGTATHDQYEQVLATVTYASTDPDPASISSGEPRTVSFQVSDGMDTSSGQIVNVFFAPQIDLDASALGTGFAATYAENGAAVAVVDADVAILDGTYGVRSAQVMLTNSQDGDDLSVTGTLPTGFTATTAITGGQITLTLTGPISATAGDYEAALQAVGYSNSSDNPSADPRSVSVTVGDGNGTSLVSQTAITVTPMNDGPTITSDGGLGAASLSIDENTTAVTTVTASDVDTATTGLSYSISGGADFALFTIDSVSGALSFTTAPNFEAPADVGADNIYDVIVTASDNIDTDTQAIAVAVTNVNEAPTLDVTATGSLAENTALRTKVADIVVTDPDQGVNANVLTVDDVRFDVVGTEVFLKAGQAVNFETEPTIDLTITSTDGSLVATDDVTITITDLNEGGGGGGTPPSTTPTAGPDNLTGTAGDDTTSAGLGNDTVASGTGNDNVFGNEGRDTLFGNEGNDQIFGGQDNDSVYGGQGDDVAYGNMGDDVVYGNLGDDQVFGNEGTDTLYGNEGADFLHGGQGNDSVFGGQDNDVLNGGLGNDVLQGGLGSDTFVFAPAQGNDIVTDFNFSQGDRLDLQGQTYSLTTANDGSAALLLEDGGVIILQGVTASEFNSSFVA